MTSKQSIFNKGIFTLTLKRFKWGSVLYFFLLFMMTCFPVLTHTNSEWFDIYKDYVKVDFLFNDGLPAFYIALAIGVPIVVAILLFRTIHSSKQTVFMHSIPVTRKNQFFSSMLGGLTLMSVPVILNGIILMLLRINYPAILRLQDCSIWIILNLIMLFIMFAIATLACVLTGNSFMAVFLYGAIQFFPTALYGVINAIGTTFVYGYYEKSAIGDFIISYTPIPFFSESMYSLPDDFFVNIPKYIIYIIISVIIYIVSAVLYNIRRSERAGDITSFRCLSPLLKYTITAMVTVLMLYISASFETANIWIMLFFTVLLSLVVYFICEMVLKKSFRVFGAYKGFIAYGIIAAVTISLISFTGFFGYRSYIPKDIKGAAVYSEYMDAFERRAYVEDENTIKYITDIHKKMLSEKTYICSDNYSEYTKPLIIEYTKSNGKQVYRKYRIPVEDLKKHIATLYDNYEDFRKSYNPVLSTDYTLDTVELYVAVYDKDYNGSAIIRNKEEMKEFYDLYVSEAKDATYEETYLDNGYFGITLKGENDINQYISLPLPNNFEKSYNWALKKVKEYEEKEEADKYINIREVRRRY